MAKIFILKAIAGSCERPPSCPFQSGIIFTTHLPPTSRAPNHAHTRLYRSSALLTISCLYIMWMCTYLSQLNPLICKLSEIAQLTSDPKRADLRVEHKET